MNQPEQDHTVSAIRRLETAPIDELLKAIEQASPNKGDRQVEPEHVPADPAAV